MTALTGSPPFAPFVSEFTIVTAAVGSGQFIAGGLFLLLLGIVFIGMGATVLAVVQGNAPEQKQPNGRGNLGWAPIAGDPTDLEYRPNSRNYSEIITVPGIPNTNGVSNFRLVVQEFEMLMGGDDIRIGKPEGRLVFADAIEL